MHRGRPKDKVKQWCVVYLLNFLFQPVVAGSWSAWSDLGCEWSTEGDPIGKRSQHCLLPMLEKKGDGHQVLVWKGLKVEKEGPLLLVLMIFWFPDQPSLQHHSTWKHYRFHDRYRCSYHKGKTTERRAKANGKNPKYYWILWQTLNIAIW